jgi:hypothetical protein
VSNVVAVAQRPEFAPVPVPEADTSADVEALWKQYQDAPDHESVAAFHRYLDAREQNFRHGVRADQIQQENARRATQARRAIASAVTDHVERTAPDVPLELFSLYMGHARAATPPGIVNPVARLEWQVQHAIGLARAKVGQLVARQQPQQEAPPEPTTWTEQIRRNRFRYGSEAPPAPRPSQPSAPPASPAASWTEQMREARARMR